VARRRKRRHARPVWLFSFIAIVFAVVLYGKFVSPVLEQSPPAPRAETPATPVVEKTQGGGEAQAVPAPEPARPVLISNRPEGGPDEVPSSPVPEKGAPEKLTAMMPVDPTLLARASNLSTAGLKAEHDGELLVARGNLSDALALGIEPQKAIDVRAALERLGRETIFSPRILPDDPLVMQHTISAGDTLAKIAKRYDITDDFLAAINQISNKHRIREGQRLKVVKGPFHCRIHKKTYQMDLYVQKTFVKHYTVGLGTDNSTPTGEWLVGTKLINPTYFPPRGGPIVAADDKENPLGEHWIELRGIAGDALGQERYGIHGTNEPQSIGQSASLGCIRMHNADVAEVYTYLVSEKSHVFVME
jgi:LysM repeat protein